MKNAIIVLLLIVSLAGNALLWHHVSALEETATAAASDYPLGENMGYLQRYADKLWYAGQAANWDLAGYYGDELDETAAGIASAHVIKDGVAVSDTLQEILPPVLASLKHAVAAHDAAQFRQQYTGLVNACNECHLAAKHPYIHIRPPEGPPAMWNQDFSVQP